MICLKYLVLVGETINRMFPELTEGKLLTFIRNVLILHPTEIPEPSNSAEGQSVYFETLQLQPVKLIVSFITTPHIDTDEKYGLKKFFH